MSAETNNLESSKNSPTRLKSFVWKLVYATPLVLAFLVFYILNVTDPTSAGVFGILMIFILFYAFFLSLFFVLIHALLSLSKKFGLKIVMSTKKIYYTATVVALMPVFLLALNSIGQLRVLDVLLVTSFVLLAGFYVVRRTSS